jgi:hypothetical protein
MLKVKRPSREAMSKLTIKVSTGSLLPSTVFVTTRSFLPSIFSRSETFLFMAEISLPLSSSRYSLTSLLLALRVIGTIGSIVRLPAYASVEIDPENVTGVSVSALSGTFSEHHEGEDDERRRNLVECISAFDYMFD